jgi:hypothetical protein
VFCLLALLFGACQIFDGTGVRQDGCEKNNPSSPEVDATCLSLPWRGIRGWWGLWWDWKEGAPLFRIVAWVNAPIAQKQLSSIVFMMHPFWNKFSIIRAWQAISVL